MNEKFYLYLCILCILLATALSIHSCFAHDIARPDLDQWFNSLHDAQGRSCCANNDYFNPHDWQRRFDGSYAVYVEGAWRAVPDYALLRTTNRVGHAMVWYFKDNGIVTIRCFLPGAEG